MMKGFFAFWLLPSSLFAWNAADHQVQGKFALQEVAADWGLNQPVSVHPLSSFLQKLPLELNQKQSFSEWLKINPKIDLEATVPELEGKETLTPFEILSLYAIDPDDGRDQDLFGQDETGRAKILYPDQFWFGGVEGPNSQAFRHIEKPPFSLRHPIATFGIPFRSVGEATDRAETWFFLSQLAFSLNEEYWGWRFLANSFHYLQDLHNPYHAGQITPSLLGRGLIEYVRWGWKHKGIINTLAHLIANSHRFYEAYVADPQGWDRGEKERALQALQGKETLSPPLSVKQLAIQVRNESNLLFPDLVGAVTQATQPFLLGEYDFLGDETEKNFKAEKFLKKGKKFEEANQKNFQITQDRFASTGRVLRTVVRMSLDRRGSKPSEKLLEELDVLLKN